MAGGTWSPTEKPVLPGLYLNFKAQALSSIQPGARGTVGIVVRANWGPDKQFVVIGSESDLIKVFTQDTSNGANAYKLIRLILLGGAKKVLAYRLVDNNAAQAQVILKDTASTDVLKIKAKYKGTRGNDFKITVQNNVIDNSKKDIKLYEGATLLKVFTVSGGSIDNVVSTINNDPTNEWIVAEKVADGNGTLVNVSSVSLTGGNSGISGITTAEYVEALSKFETQEFNLFVLDGITDIGILSSLKAWVERLRGEGRGIIAVIGGSAEDDKASDAVSRAVARSATMDYEGIVNVGVGAYEGTVEYSSAEVACWVAGLIAGQRLVESPTYATAPFSDVNRRWTKTEMEQAVEGGVLLLYHDGEKVKILKGINTLTNLREGQNNAWKKIRTIRVMDAINTDLLRTAEKSYIGKINNTEAGRNSLIGAMREYMRQLALAGVIESIGWDVYLDPDYSNPEHDEVYIKWEARLTDVMEKIFGTFIVK